MTAARINLLPHREERRKAARQHFFVIAGGTAVLGAVIVLAMHTFYAAKIEIQAERNRFLKSEIAKLDKEIAEINKLKGEIQALEHLLDTPNDEIGLTLMDERLPKRVRSKSVKASGAL